MPDTYREYVEADERAQFTGEDSRPGLREQIKAEGAVEVLQTLSRRYDSLGQYEVAEEMRLEIDRIRREVGA